MVYTKEASKVELIHEGAEQVLRINYEAISHSPSIEDNPLVMMDAIDKLVGNPSTSRITFSQRRNFNYNYEQTQMLVEFANIYSYFVKNKKAMALENLGVAGDPPELLGQRLESLRYILFSLLKADPLGSYMELKRLIRQQMVTARMVQSPIEKQSYNKYIESLQKIYKQMDETKLINVAREYLAGYTVGQRDIYKMFFRPSITPNFMYSKLMTSPPEDGKQLAIYKINPTCDVTIYQQSDDLKNLYQINPPEFNLSEDQYELLELAKKVLAEHQPRNEEFLDPEKLRATFTNIGRDMIRELAESKGMLLDPEEIKDLAAILVRHTIGFGLVELLLEDEKVQDLTINSPMGEVPIFLLHDDHNECVTNIVPTSNDFESWATKFRLLSGRPLDEANPILDTEIHLPKARSRLSVVGKPLNPYGYGMSFRRHRDNPWTLPLFINNNMISSLGAGLLSFTIGGARSHVVAGTRSSGKTSFLGSLLLEISRKFRILTIEDSVTSDSEILVKKSGQVFRTTIGEMVDTQVECFPDDTLSAAESGFNGQGIQVLSMNKEGKISFSSPSRFLRHKVNKPIYLVKTRTGREIKVTGDHSLFTLNSEADIAEIKTDQLKQGSYIATPRNYDTYNYPKRLVKITDSPKNLNRLYFRGGNIKEFLEKHQFEIKQLGKDHGYKKCQIGKWFRQGLIPGKILSDLDALTRDLHSLKGVEWKCGHNALNWLPNKIILDKGLLVAMGLWLADGCYDKSSLIFSVSTVEERNLVYYLGKRFNLQPKLHSSDGLSLMLHSTSLKFLFKDVLGLVGNSFTKRIPSLVFGLSKQQVACVLNGLFTGDGCVSDKEIVISLNSKKMMQDIQTLLLQFGIIFRIQNRRKDSNSYPGALSTVRDFKIYRAEIGILQQYKIEALDKLCEKKSSHCSTDVIPLPLEFKKKLRGLSNSFNYRDYVLRNNNVGRNKCGAMLQQFSQDVAVLSKLKVLSESDLYWDKVKSVELLEYKEQYVYDLSVPGNESFIVNNVVAHNTLELPTESMRKLGYNIQPLKVRSALAKGGSEVPADEGIRTSLRLGDSALIVGEVRSKEVVALFEAMRIGASANVVAGTFHADSPFGVYDRVTNDLGVPKTSFKAMDIIVICAPIQSASGMHKVRRVVSITEVRKNWEDDPMREGGFVDLMRYNAKTDKLEPTPDLINGDSEVLKGIGGNVKEWAGNWDAIWENILLRSEIKRLVSEYGSKANMHNLMEAEFSLRSNDKMYRLMEQVKEEVGSIDCKRIQKEFEEWLRQEVLKKQIQGSRS